MKIKRLIWFDYIRDKLKWKYNVDVQEVQEVLNGKPKFFFKEKGKVEGEHLYQALGKTDAGRYLTVFFILKNNDSGIVISARAMNDKEKKRYEKK